MPASSKKYIQKIVDGPDYFEICQSLLMNCGYYFEESYTSCGVAGCKHDHPPRERHPTFYFTWQVNPKFKGDDNGSKYSSDSGKGNFDLRIIQIKALKTEQQYETQIEIVGIEQGYRHSIKIKYNINTRKGMIIEIK